MTDRIAGLVLLGFAALYGFGAFRLKVGFGSDALGPKAFPYMLAIVMAICAVAIIIRIDPDPTWFKARGWINIAIVTSSFILYAYLLVPIGFIAATTLETGFVSQRFGAKWLPALVTGLVSSLVMYALFVFALGLPLPIGRIFGGN